MIYMSCHATFGHPCIIIKKNSMCLYYYGRHIFLFYQGKCQTYFLICQSAKSCFHIPIQFYQKFDYRAVGFFFWTKSRKLKETKSIQHVLCLILVMKKLIWLLKCPYTYYIRIFLTLMYKDYKIKFVYTSPCHAQ